ncbi:MAG: hypothetical protein HYV34_00945 [Candidatus Kerfeldbacteria bacterium]|nr:hypothetical protein [Candidatus Kerfeldbacteria bacterium]
METQTRTILDAWPLIRRALLELLDRANARMGEATFSRMEDLQAVIRLPQKLDATMLGHAVRASAIRRTVGQEAGLQRLYHSFLEELLGVVQHLYVIRYRALNGCEPDQPFIGSCGEGFALGFMSRREGPSIDDRFRTGILYARLNASLLAIQTGGEAESQRERELQHQTFSPLEDVLEQNRIQTEVVERIERVLRDCGSANRELADQALAELSRLTNDPKATELCLIPPA